MSDIMYRYARCCRVWALSALDGCGRCGYCKTWCEDMKPATRQEYEEQEAARGEA